MLRHLTRRLAGEGIFYKALGLDLNPLAIREAQAVAALEQGRPGGGELTFATGGIEALRSRRVDLVVGTFLLHHLDLVQLRELFKVLNDSVGFAVYQLDFRPDGPAWMRALWQGALALFGYSRQTRADGLISIGRSRPAEVLVEVGRSCGLRFETKTCLGLCLEVLGVRSDHFAAFSIHARS